MNYAFKEKIIDMPHTYVLHSTHVETPHCSILRVATQ